MKFYKEMMLICTLLTVMGQVSAVSVTVSINNSASTGYPLGVGLDKWNIIITPMTLPLDPTDITTGFTNSSGMKVFNLSDGTYIVGTINYKGGGGLATPNYIGTTTINGTEGPEVLTLEVSGSDTNYSINKFSQAGAIRGYVKSGGSGIKATIYVTDSNGTDLFPTFSKSNGYYSFFLPAAVGNYTLEYTKSEYVKQTRSRQVTKGSGSTYLEFLNVTLSKPQSSSSSGGGGGGGGTETSYTTYIKDVSKDGTSSLDIDDEDVPYLIGLSLTAKQSIYSSTLSITNYDKKPWSSMADPDGNAYKYFKVSYNKDNYVENARLDFRVNTSWLEDNDINLDTIKMLRFTTAWNKLDTKFIKEDGGWAYFMADTPGFSYFSITGVNGSGYSLPVEEEEQTTAPVEGEIEITTTTTTLVPTVVTLQPTVQPPTTTPPQIPLPAETDRSWIIWAVIGIVFVMAVIMFVNNMKE